ncbi:uncharacterized protein TRAVEDRAFT_44060 [Trametes versicolor FP-101664 SS1]|uniref:uncharacterized protein n=1 Tax=Trametes versicolor (strain FP-101664) TaxID=717944 RepID=UPI000462135B|nr:uncharacterized protein TRAVEDRAFT_44060 [Trametes versicolor FP-101664 SS1]EIW61239.1 hypothetical protein TRAVEDRAFT_44060 [Trametes versicolor FP-101664 SS1]
MDHRTYRRTIPEEIVGSPCPVDLPLSSSREGSPHSDNPEFSDPLPNITDFNPGRMPCFPNASPTYPGVHQNASPHDPETITPTPKGKQSEFRNLGHPFSHTRPEEVSFPLHPVGDGWPRLPTKTGGNAPPLTPQAGVSESAATQARLGATTQPRRVPAVTVRKSKKRLRTASLDAELDSGEDTGPQPSQTAKGKRAALPVNPAGNTPCAGEQQMAPTANAFYHTWSLSDHEAEMPVRAEQAEQAGHPQAQAHLEAQAHSLPPGTEANAAVPSLPGFDEYIQGAIHNYYTTLAAGQELFLPLLSANGGALPTGTPLAQNMPADPTLPSPIPQHVSQPPVALLQDSIHAPARASMSEKTAPPPPDSMDVDGYEPELRSAPSEPPRAMNTTSSKHEQARQAAPPAHSMARAPRASEPLPAPTGGGPKSHTARTLTASNAPPAAAPAQPTMPRVIGRAEYLRNAGILNVLSEPEGGFPKKHAQSTRDLLRGLPESMADTWEGLSGKNHAILEVFMQERRSDKPYLDAVERVIRTTFGKILDSTRLTLLSATEGQDAAASKTLSLIWMLYNCTDAEMATLAQQFVWPTPDLTACVHTVFVCIPEHLLTYTGFKIPYDVTIKKGVTAAFLQNEPFRALVKLLKLEHGDRAGVDYAAMARAVVQGIRVKPYRVGKADGPGEIVASVYCDPPTTNAGAWYTWQCALFNTTVTTDLNETATPRTPVRCSVCHAGDHDERNCPFEEVEGWFGKLNLGPLDVPAPQPPQPPPERAPQPAPQPPQPPQPPTPAPIAQQAPPSQHAQRPPTRARTPQQRGHHHQGSSREMQPPHPQNGALYQQPPPPYSSAAGAWPLPLPPPHAQPMLRQPYTAPYPPEAPYPPYYPQHQPYYYHPQFYAQPQYAPAPATDRVERYEEYEEEGSAGHNGSQSSSRGRGGNPPRGGPRRRGQYRSQNPPAPRM